MYYITSIAKKDNIKKVSLLHSFEQLEYEHRTVRGEIKNISLYCKYEFSDEERSKFYNEDIDIYLKVDDESDKVEKFINNYKFIKVSSLPKNVKIICGNDNPVCIALNWNIR